MALTALKGASNMKKFRCSKCQEIPEDEVFQCPDGHIICGPCQSGAQTCPQCGILFPMKIRVPLLETIMDSLELECAYKEHGCEIKLNRREASLHNEICKFRPSVSLCQQMGIDCGFEIKRENATAAVVDHFKECHQFQESTLDEPIDIVIPEFHAGTSPSQFVSTPMLVKTVVGQRQSPVYSVVFTVTNWKQNNFSVACVDLTDLVQNEAPEFRAQFLIKSNRRRIQDLSWNVTPFFSMTCKELLHEQAFRLSAPLLQKHYISADRSLTIEYGVNRWKSRSRFEKIHENNYSGTSSNGISVMTEQLSVPVPPTPPTISPVEEQAQGEDRDLNNVSLESTKNEIKLLPREAKSCPTSSDASHVGSTSIQNTALLKAKLREKFNRFKQERQHQRQ